MKKTNFNESVKRFKERIKNDKKFKTQFATVMVASVVVVATAITVPTVIHNNKIKAKEDTSVPIVAETETETVTIPDGVETTVDEQGKVVAVTNENGEYVYTTAAPQTEPETETEAPKETSKQQDASKPAANKPQSKKNNGSNNKNNGGNKGSAGNTATQNPNSRPTTEADAIEAVEEAKKYAISRGFVIDPSLNKDNSTWGPQIAVRQNMYPERKAKLSKDLRDRVDSTYQRIRYGGIMANFSDEEYKEYRKEHPATINIFYESRPFDSEEPYYIYVVF